MLYCEIVNYNVAIVVTDNALSNPESQTIYPDELIILSTCRWNVDFYPK